MITGYNTDVKHRNRVFHIQTEDKGESNPSIESLVYVGGEILATRRTSYSELIQDGPSEQAIQELMEQQHRTMIAAVQRGRFDGPDGSLRVPEEMAPKRAGAAPPTESAPAASETPTSAGDRTLDQVILEYLASELTQDQVDVTLTPAPELVAGKPSEFKLKAEASLSRQPIGGAAVHVRILSTAGRPAVVFQGKTAGDGSCTVRFAVPEIAEGNAVGVIRVTSGNGSTELKYPVRKQ